MREYTNRHTVNLDMRYNEDVAIHNDLMNYRTIAKGEFRTKEQYIKFCLRYTKENYFDKKNGANVDVTLVDILNKISELENEWKKQNMLLLKKVEELTRNNMSSSEPPEKSEKEDASEEGEITSEMEDLAKMWG